MYSIKTQVENNLLNRNELDIDFLNKSTQKILAKKVDFCDFYLQYSMSESWFMDEGIIKSGSFGVNQGIGIRAICEEKAFLSYSNSITQSAINKIIDNFFVEPALKPNNGYVRATEDKASHVTLYSELNPITSYVSSDKVNLLQIIDAKARSKPYVTNVIASLNLEYDEILISRSDGRAASDIRPLIHISISIIINHNGKTEKGSSGFGGRYNLDKVTPEILEFHVSEAYKHAMHKVEAKPAPCGEMQVVLGNGWAGVILHEAVGHGLEGDFNRKGSSAFSNKIGTQVASSDVTVIDEGSIMDRRGSLNIDDEGNPTQRNVLIENGILKGYMLDELNAKLMGLKPTGNGRRESFECPPLPRMTNTYMLGGKYTREEIIGSVENGIYAESFEGGQVDITSGQFVFNASVAWLIKNGKLAYPIKGCALVGNGPECLKYVSMVGNDLALDSGIGVCGKNGQSVPVGVGQPTIRIDGGLVVGGSQET